MSLPWIGAAGMTRQVVAQRQETAESTGIPVRCREGIVLSSTEDGNEGIYMASVLEEACIVPILKQQGKDSNPRRKFTKEDQIAIKNWWNAPENVPEEWQDDVTDILGNKDTRFTSQMALFDKISEYYINLGVKIEDIDTVVLLRDKVDTGSFVGTPLDSLGDGVNEGLDAVSNTLDSIQDILKTLTDPFNLLRLTVLVIAAIMIQRGLVRVMSSDRAYDAQGA